MTHMCIAKNVSALKPNAIKDLPQFYLGSLAPDAVHFRAGFGSLNDKKTSHLYFGDERWAEVSKNDEWIADVMQFLHKHKDSPNIDFINGYCAHVLTDIRNNIDLASPIKMKLYGSITIPDYEKGYDSEFIKMYQSDILHADKKIYLSSHFRDEIWSYLSSSKGLTLDGIIYEDEVNKIRDNILFNQYKDISIDDTYHEHFISYEKFTQFTEKTSEIIANLIFD